MSELISGKDALIAFANGDAIEFRNKALKPCPWSIVESEFQLGFFSNILLEFRLKPKTITINGVGVPAFLVSIKEHESNVILKCRLPEDTIKISKALKTIFK